MARRRQPVPQVVEAEQFILRDRRGAARAVLSMVDDRPTLTMHGADGRGRVTIHVGEEDNGALVNLEAGNGAFIGMSASQSGRVGLSIARPGGMFAPTVGIAENEGLRVVVYDKEGRPVFSQNIGPPDRS